MAPALSLSAGAPLEALIGNDKEIHHGNETSAIQIPENNCQEAEQQESQCQEVCQQQKPENGSSKENDAERG